MTECPSCHQQVNIEEKYFGTLYNCPRCSAVYFVDWNGIPESTTIESNQDSSRVSSEEPGPPTFDKDLFSVSQSESHTQDQSQYGNEQFQQSVPPPFSLDLSQPPNYESVPLTPMMPVDEAKQKSAATDTSNLREVSDYANEIQQGGILTYSIQISGIDTAQIRDELREILIDEKFGWDADVLVKQIKRGELVLSKVSAVKASVLLNKIKYLSLKIKWWQDVYA